MARSEQELRARITADDKDFQEKTRRSEKRGKSFGDRMKQVGAMIAAAFVFKKAYDSIRNLINGIMEMADRLSDLADMTGMATDEIQEYQYLAKIAGVNTEAVTNAATQLTRRFQNLHSEASPISRAFKELGIEAHDSAGQLRATGEIMDDLILELAEMENQTQRNAMGAQMFGGAWEDLAPILAMGADGIEKVRQEARDMGIVMDEEAIKSANELRQQTVRLQESSAALKRMIGMELIPILADLADGFITATNAIRELDFKKLAANLGERVFMSAMGTLDKYGISLGKITEGYKYLKDMQEGATEAQEDFIEPIIRTEKTIADYKDELKKLQEEYETLAPSQRGRIEANLREQESIKQLLAELENLGQTIEEETEPAAREFEATVISTDEHIQRLNESVSEAEGLLEGMAETIDLGGDNIDIMGEKIDLLAQYFDLANDAASRFGAQVMFAAHRGIDSMEEYGRAVANVARQNISAYLAEAVALAVRNAFGRGGFAGLILAPIMAGAASAAFNSLVPSFAQGGAVSGPTLALVGEGPGVSRSNPEYIGTARQMGQMGISGNLNAVAKIKKGDLLFVFNEAQNYHNRTH